LIREGLVKRGEEQVQYIKVVAAAVSGEKAIGESWEKKRGTHILYGILTLSLWWWCSYIL
jgi:hypothetical protein